MPAALTAAFCFAACGAPGTATSSEPAHGPSDSADVGTAAVAPGDTHDVPEPDVPGGDLGTPDAEFDSVADPEVDGTTASEAAPEAEPSPPDPLASIRSRDFCRDPEAEDLRQLLREELESSPEPEDQLRLGGCGQSLTFFQPFILGCDEGIRVRYARVQVGRHDVAGFFFTDFAGTHADGRAASGSALYLDGECFRQDVEDPLGVLWRRLRRPMDLTLEQAAGLAAVALVFMGVDLEQGLDFVPTSHATREERQVIGSHPPVVEQGEGYFSVEAWSEFEVAGQPDPRMQPASSCWFVVRLTVRMYEDRFETSSNRWAVGGDSSCGRLLTDERRQPSDPP